MTSGFQAAIYEGEFGVWDPNSKNSLHLTQANGETQRVRDLLSPFLGTRVRIATHHLPSDPPDGTQWGAGSCMTQHTGQCVFGHATDPTKMFQFSEEGLLQQHTLPDMYTLTQFDGTIKWLFLALNLGGHRGRIAVASLLDVEKMRDIVSQANVADLVTRSHELASKISFLKKKE